MYIQFYYPKRLSFSPVDYEDGLGGSEASLVLLSKSMAEKGHRVEVYNACWVPGNYDGVVWKGAWEIDSAPAPDVLVHVRTKSSVIRKAAAVHIFWMLDDRPDGAIEFQREYPGSCVALSSEAMRRRAVSAGYRGNVKKIFLPVDRRVRTEWSPPRNSRYCIHSSMPNRGLKELLEIWPLVRKRVPDAKLYVTSGWELWGYTKEEAKDKWNQVMGHDYGTDGVVLTGVLPKDKLYALLNGARFSVIPSHFQEMFCIAAAEAEATGKPLIVSDYEALSERVDNGVNGFKISGNIGSEPVRNEFAEKMTELFADDSLADIMGNNSRIRGESYDAGLIADNWEKLIRGE